MRSTVPSFSALAIFAVAACHSDSPPEPDAIRLDPQTNQQQQAPAGGDPKHGEFSIADATKDLPGTGPIVATIDTSMGALSCRLYDDKAPITVANFIGLARGTRPWKDPFTGKWINKPAYDGTTFHRIIKGFMIQGGDAKGNGTGEPGYVFKDEVWPGAKHDRAGLICMANRGKNTNGAQFFITDAAAAHLDSGYTIFGECTPEATIHSIASVPVRGEAPISKVVINSITIARGSSQAAATSDAGAPPTSSADAGKDGAK